VSEEECAIGFDAVDEDQNGTIEFSEFVAWWTDR
jgi:Ca2+-binding EF-hand superfamily protein